MKYKNKYNNLKNLKGGAPSDELIAYLFEKLSDDGTIFNDTQKNFEEKVTELFGKNKNEKYFISMDAFREYVQVNKINKESEKYKKLLAIFQILAPTTTLMVNEPGINIFSTYHVSYHPLYKEFLKEIELCENNDEKVSGYDDGPLSMKYVEGAFNYDTKINKNNFLFGKTFGDFQANHAGKKSFIFMYLIIFNYSDNIIRISLLSALKISSIKFIN